MTNPLHLLMAFALGSATLVAQPTAAQGDKPDYQHAVLIQLAVSDLDRSIAFYRDVLGLELESRTDPIRWARMSTANSGVTIGLGEQPAEAVKGSGSTSFNLSVGDIDRARAILEQRGVRFAGPTIDIPGVVRLADFEDPDGNRIRLAGAWPGSSGGAVDPGLRTQ